MKHVLLLLLSLIPLIGLSVIMLALLMSSCSTVNNYSRDSMEHKDRQVHNFKDIPYELLNNLDKMGIDTLSELNEYETNYLNYIFRLDTCDYNFVGAKVRFIGSKKDFFVDERERFKRGEKSGVGGCGLYILNANQKKNIGGYDAVISYWKKLRVSDDKLIVQLKRLR